MCYGQYTNLELAVRPLPFLRIDLQYYLDAACPET